MRTNTTVPQGEVLIRWRNVDLQGKYRIIAWNVPLRLVKLQTIWEKPTREVLDPYSEQEEEDNDSRPTWYSLNDIFEIEEMSD